MKFKSKGEEAASEEIIKPGTSNIPTNPTLGFVKAAESLGRRSCTVGQVIGGNSDVSRNRAGSGGGSVRAVVAKGWRRSRHARVREEEERRGKEGGFGGEGLERGWELGNW